MDTDLTVLAREWVAAWNAHDLDRILSHYTEDVVFRSQKAIALTGSGEVRGKPALRAYWGRALEQQPDLHFTLRDMFHGHRMMVVTYLNHRGVKASEVLMFDDAGLVHQAAACHVPE